ncbi:MAG: diguanylate cyclase domain-containing protein, partial [Bellilinea sp.]
YMVQPDREDILGINLNVPSSFFTRHMESGQEASVATGTLYATGEARMMATNLVRPSNLNMDYPVMVTASRNLGSIYRVWKKETILHGGLFVLLFVVSAIGLLFSQKRRQTAESEKQAAELELNEAKTRLENFFNIAPDLLCIASVEGRFLKLNPSWETVLGYPLSELENARFLDFVHPDDVEATLNTLSALGKGAMVTNFTNRYRHRDGSYRHIEWRTAPYGNLLYAAARDVSERMRLDDAIRRQAFYDELTQLPNRALLLERLQQEIAHAKRDRTLLALIFIDLDKFKPVNDEYGHVVGDWLLQMVAQRIERCIRESDTAARLGGDEFVVLLPNMSSAKDALPTAEKIREVLEQPFITSDGLSLEISSSIGVAIYPNDATGAQELLLMGDDAMYMAKDAGRNRVKALEN